jgi:hypothetical protein
MLPTSVLRGITCGAVPMYIGITHFIVLNFVQQDFCR